MTMRFKSERDRELCVTRVETITFTLAIIGIIELGSELLYNEMTPSFIFLIFAIAHWLWGLHLVDKVEVEQYDENK